MVLDHCSQADLKRCQNSLSYNIVVSRVLTIIVNVLLGGVYTTIVLLLVYYDCEEVGMECEGRSCD